MSDALSKFLERYVGYVPPAGTGAFASAQFTADHEHDASQITGTFTNIVLANDFWTTNWDGAVPADLTSSEDTTATKGAYIDSSAGAMQISGSMFVGGNVSLFGSGVMRSASSGRRIEMGVTPTIFSDPHLEWYTAHAMETSAGSIRMYVEDDAGVGFLDVGAFAEIRTPTIDFGSSSPLVYTAFQLWSEQDNDAAVPQAILVASADTITTPAILGFDTISGGSIPGWQLQLNAGTAALPSLAFGHAAASMSDPNTGIFWVSGDIMGFASGGGEKFRLDTGNFYHNATGGASLKSGAGSEALPAFTFQGDEDSGMFRRSANLLGFSGGGQMMVAMSAGGATNITSITQSARLLIGGATSMNNIGMRRNSTSAQNQIVFENPNNIVGSIVSSGSSTSFNTSSDERRKAFMRHIPEPVRRLMALKATRHTWKEDPQGDEMESITAQSILPVAPWAVSYEIEDDTDSRMLADYSRLMPLLVATIQDQERRLRILEAA